QALGHGAGHGTHVTGIAAGAEVTDAAGVLPRGMAPKAKIVMVKAIGVQGSRIDLGLTYIFQKAAELKLPCVVNMSFGGHWDSHDGPDPDSAYIPGLLRDAKGNPRKGRVVVAWAGNERWDPIHVRRD